MGAEPPVYAHLPLLHGPDGKKLSKRHGAASVQELRDRATCPRPCVNYLALLGWGYDETTTFFTTDELQERFSLERVSKNPAVFDEQKLRWMNGRYLRELTVDDLTGAPGGVHRPRPGCASAVGDHAGEDLDARRVLAAGAARSSTGRSTTRRRARSSSAPRSPRAGARRDAREALGRAAGAVDRRTASRRRCAASSSARAQAEAGLPAAAGRVDRNDRFTRYLRDRRAAGARRDAGEGRTRA